MSEELRGIHFRDDDGHVLGPPVHERVATAVRTWWAREWIMRIEFPNENSAIATVLITVVICGTLLLLGRIAAFTLGHYCEHGDKWIRCDAIVAVHQIEAKQAADNALATWNGRMEAQIYAGAKRDEANVTYNQLEAAKAAAIAASQRAAEKPPTK